ncbi:hypothetical protein O181_024830 [Austropuccinia psidii MF-1]|uniref:Uncharacterized protein n=1 Tax=Austropuccinia psidii MF-1 TaxID=1389203 RepID=A0A9Q3CLJ8_9BASI|nr:hypothetical protein [Austropuccinia psidii MF-1]
MILSNLYQLIVSCGIVLLYSFLGNVLSSSLGFARQKVTQNEKNTTRQDEHLADEEGKCRAIERLKPQGASHDAIQLIRLSNAFCPPDTQPSIFGRTTPKLEVGTFGHNAGSASEDNNAEDEGERFSDVHEKPPFCFHDSVDNPHSRRITIKPPAFVHLASVAEIETGERKSTSSERLTSTTFAPDTHDHDNEKSGRFFSIMTKPNSASTADLGTRAKAGSFPTTRNPLGHHGSPQCHPTEKKKKLFRPSISALRRLSPPKHLDHDEAPKSRPVRIDYMNTVRTRFKLISSKKLLKSGPKSPPAGNSLLFPSSGGNARRMSSLFYTPS